MNTEDRPARGQAGQMENPGPSQARQVEDTGRNQGDQYQYPVKEQGGHRERVQGDDQAEGRKRSGRQRRSNGSSPGRS